MCILITYLKQLNAISRFFTGQTSNSVQPPQKEKKTVQCCISDFPPLMSNLTIEFKIREDKTIVRSTKFRSKVLKG